MNIKESQTNVLNSKQGAYPFSKSRYVLQPYFSTRHFMIDAAKITSKMNMVHFTSKIDVAEALAKISNYKKKKGKSLSFTTFISCCFIKAIEENKIMQGYRKNRIKTILFNEIDVFFAIEKKIQEYKQPFYLIIRNAQNKNFFKFRMRYAWQKRSIIKSFSPLWIDYFSC